MTVVQTRLLAYSPNGASLGQLPTPQEWSASFPRSDVGALTVTYNPKAIQGTLLGQPLEVALEVQKADGTGWVETPNGRFLYLRDGRDPVADDAYQAECPSYGRRLEKAVIPFTGLNSEGMRQFTTSTDGAILHTLLTEAQARDALTGITWTFTATHDSAGWAWGSSRNQAFEPGKNLLAVLQEMASDGRLDWRFQGRELQVYVASTAGPAGSMSVDTTVSATPVTFRAGRDLTDAPFRRTWEGLADTVLVGGDNRVNTTRQNAAALKPWGRQETYVAASGVGDTGTLSILGDLVLQTTSGVRAEHTATLSLADAAHVPLIDYQPGWWVNRAPDGNAAERVRLQQVTLTMDANGTLGGNVVLNDRFLERDVLLQRMVQGIINGTTGGTPTDPTVGVGNDILAPAQVTGLIGSSLAYLDGAIMRAQVSLDWNDVTTNADGSTATDVAEYQVDYRKGTSDPFARMTDVASGTSGVTWSPLTPDTLYQFRVRAVDTVGNEGAWSATYSLTTGKDTTPPAPPSAPVLTARLGVVTVAWDGLNDVGAAMDADLAYVEVHASVTAGFAGTTTTTVVGYLEGKGATPVAMPYGTVYARLRAVDKSGNKSTPSAIANITNPALVDTDVIGKVIDGARLKDGTVPGPAIAPASITTGKIAVTDFTNLWPNQTFAHPEPLVGAASAQVPPVGTARQLDARDHIGATATAHSTFPAKTGQEFLIEFTAKRTAGTQPLWAGLWASGPGVTAPWDTSFGSSPTMVADLGNGWGRYQRVHVVGTGGGGVPNAAALYFQIDQASSGGATQWHVADVTVRRRAGGELIVDGAVTAAKVASLAIDTGHLAANAVKADKVDAGAITGIKISGDAIDGKTITGAIIRTTATPSRGVRLDTGGITAWNGSGVQTFRVDATTGAVSLLGDLTAGSTVTGATVQTAASGNRLVIRQDSGAGVIEAFTGDTYEQLPGKIDPTYAATDGGIYSLRLQPGYHATGWATGERPTLVLSSRSRLAGVAGYVGMTAGQISLTGATTVTGAATVTSTLTAQGAGNGLVVSNSALVYGSVQVNGSVATNNISPASGSQVGFGAGTYVNMPGTIKTGTSTVNISAVNTNATANVSFPIAFPAGGPVPTVVLTATGLTGNTVIKLAASAVTRSGFTVNAVRSSGTGNMTVDWLAVAA